MAFETEISVAASKYSVDASLIQAQVQHESNFDPFAIGDGGAALGLMQVHSGAAQDVGGDWNALLRTIQAGDEAAAVAMGLDIGVAYLSKMLKLFDGSQWLALMAYNQGPTVINRANSYAAAVFALLKDTMKGQP